MLRRMLYSQLLGTVLYGVDGIKVGQVRRVLVDEITGRPEWVAVSTGALGARQRLVPIAAADLQLGGIRVPYSAAVVLASPRFDPRDAAPDQAGEEELYRHYGMDSEPPPTRLAVADLETDSDADSVPTVPTDDGSPAPTFAGWDLGKIRQLLEQAFSDSQLTPGHPRAIHTIVSALPSLDADADADAEKSSRLTEEGHVDRGHRS